MQPASTNSLWPWSFLHPHLQWHGFAMPQFGVGAWPVRACLWTLKWKWKHGTFRSGMYAIFFFLCVCETRWQCPHNTWKTSAGLWRYCNVKCTSLFNWHIMFSEGRTIVEYEQRSGRPSTTRTARIRELIRSDRRWTVKMIADELKHEPSQPFVWYRLKNCGWGQFVPRWCPGMSQSNSWIYGQAQFVTSKCITVMPQPPFSPNLAPRNFFLFRKVKSAVKGHHSESSEDTQTAGVQALKDIP